VRAEEGPLSDHAVLAPSRTRSGAATGCIGGLIDPWRTTGCEVKYPVGRSNVQKLNVKADGKRGDVDKGVVKLRS
jgi:hypothetical protein